MLPANSLMPPPHPSGSTHPPACRHLAPLAAGGVQVHRLSRDPSTLELRLILTSIFDLPVC